MTIVVLCTVRLVVQVIVLAVTDSHFFNQYNNVTYIDCVLWLCVWCVRIPPRCSLDAQGLHAPPRPVRKVYRRSRVGPSTAHSLSRGHFAMCVLDGAQNIRVRPVYSILSAAFLFAARCLRTAAAVRSRWCALPSFGSLCHCLAVHDSDLLPPSWIGASLR
jgi:hypothetical protein